MTERRFGRAFQAMQFYTTTPIKAYHKMAFQRIDKKFVMSDSSVNEYGMRLMTNGYQMGEFTKNPIGYYRHKPDDGVLLKWDDVALEDDKVVGYPCINLSHPRAERTISEIQDGFINSASVGKLKILEYHLEDNADDPENPIVVVTKWFNKECSVVENPGNRNALKVELEDCAGAEICLEDMRDNLRVKKNSDKNERVTIYCK